MGIEMMNKQLAIWGTVLTLVVASSAAWAIGDSNQKGSLLVFPRIDVTGSKTTLISITNDSGPTYVHCYYLGANKDILNFEFPLTLQDMENFQVRPVDFPGSVKKGALVCWAERPETTPNTPYTPVSHNHLFGKATVIDFAAGTAYEYKAWAFKAIPPAGQLVGTAGTLLLDGTNYETCPKTLLGEFFGKDRGAVPPTRTLLTVASCTLDLQQDAKFIATKLEFDVFGDNEYKLTNAWECSDSWHETYLGEPNTPMTDPGFPAVWGNRSGTEQLEQNAANFNTATNSHSVSGLGWYRVYTSAKANCNAYVKPVTSTTPDATLAQRVGLVGVQVTEMKFGDPTAPHSATTASNLSMSGSVLNGSIQYTPNTGQEEKKSQ